MSRAFVKESEPPDPVCPEREGCGHPGEPVLRETVESLATPMLAAQLASQAYFCPSPRCAVAYFDAWGSRILVADLARRIWPKDLDAPLCPCFGILESELEADGRAQRRDRLRDLIARSATPEAHCATRAGDGKCCVPAARRVWLRASGLSPGGG